LLVPRESPGIPRRGFQFGERGGLCDAPAVARRRVDCGQLDPGAVIQPIRGEWQPRMPERLDEVELADWRAGRNAIYQLAAKDAGVPSFLIE
jgi:hypothetical protein